MRYVGFRNTELFGNRIRLVEIFVQLGVRCVKLAYNNRNCHAGSCYEAEDSGLARFGRELITEMNRARIPMDLSHVGSRSTLDAVKVSRKPVAITHANADSRFPHQRNRTDDVLHALRDNGGAIGCATCRNLTGDRYCATVENWCTMLLRTVALARIDHAGVATDRSHNVTKPHCDRMRMGRWRRGVDYGAGSVAKPGKVGPPDWFPRVEDIGTIEGGLKAMGFSAEGGEDHAWQLAARVGSGPGRLTRRHHAGDPFVSRLRRARVARGGASGRSSAAASQASAPDAARHALAPPAR